MRLPGASFITAATRRTPPPRSANKTAEDLNRFSSRLLEALRNRVIRAAKENSPAGLLKEEASLEARDAAAVVDAEHDTKAAWVLGMFHWLRYLALPDGDDLEDYLAAVRLLAPVHDVDPEVVPSALRERYEQIRNHDGPPPPDPVELNSRARKLLSRYEQTGDVPLLSSAVACFQNALSATPGGDSALAWRQSNLGAALRMLFVRTGHGKMLTEAIGLLRGALAHAGDDVRPACQSNLAGALLSQHLLSREAALVTEAVALLRAAADGIPADSPERGEILSNLAAARTVQAEADSTSDSLAEAVESHRRVLADCPDGDPDRDRYLANLGGALQALAERTSDRLLLAEAAQVQRAAVSACPEHHPDRPGYLSNLAATLSELSEATGDEGQLSEAVALFRAALAAAPSGDVNRPGYLSNFAAAALRLGERSGETSLMVEGIEAHRIAVDQIPDGHAERPIHLSNLGLALQAMYERTGNTNLLAEAVAVQRAALADARAGQSGEASYLSSLGAALRIASAATGNTSDLAEAVSAGRTAVAAIPPGDPGMAAHLSNLGAALQLMSEQTEQPELLTEAVQTLRAAAAVSPPGDPGRPGHLSNLGLSLLALFDHTGQLALLQEAVHIHRDAVACCPPGHLDRAGYLSNVGIALQSMFRYIGEERALAESIAAFRAAVAATASDHPDRATYLVNLANALQIDHDRTPEVGQTPHPGPLAEAAARYAEAASNSGVPAVARIYAYRQVSRLAIRRGAGQDALIAAEAAVTLLPQVTPATLVRRDRERQVGQLAGLAGDVAAAAISADRPDRAVELLEQTRGLLVAENLQARSGDLTKLRATETGAKLAAAFEEMQHRIDALDWATPDTWQQVPAGSVGDFYQPGAWQAAQSLTQIRQQAHQAWEELINEIRSSEFPLFLQPPVADELTGQASEGPVVFVFTSPIRCGALVLTASPTPHVRAIPLPALTESEAYRKANQLREARISATAGPGSSTPESRRAAERQILDVLGWMWDVIAEPLLADLGCTTSTADQDWSRLWWCPVGILAYLPLHAAGHHTDTRTDDPMLRGNPRTMLDRVVSSYTPTIRSLAYARAQRQTPIAGPPLIVAVPEAPGTSPLPGVAAEAEALLELMPDAHLLADPRRSNVLEALPKHAVAHFACHGYADLIDPGASELVMPDRQVKPLILRDISAQQLNARLAYLSACDTMFVRQNLADEAVHMTGAFHLAGYQQVIGTLWSINDAIAKALAMDVYGHLVRNEAIDLDTDLVPRALHQAIRNLRTRYPGNPSLWITYTHTGA